MRSAICHKSFTFLFLFSIFYLLFSSQAFADVSCQPIYGGGQSCITTYNILIDKKILNPETNRFTDNLSIKDPKYYPDFIAAFRLTIKNSSKEPIENIDVKDTFPQYVAYSSGPGKFDKDTNTLSFSIKNLKPNESKTFTIMGRIAAIDKMSINKGATICVVNQANASSGSNNYSQDNSQFCIENSKKEQNKDQEEGFPVLSPVPIKTTPATGAGLLSLIAITGSGILGFILRRKT